MTRDAHPAFKHTAEIEKLVKEADHLYREGQLHGGADFLLDASCTESLQ